MSAKARRCHPEEKTLGRYSHDVAGWMSQSVGHARAIAFDTYSTVRWMFCPRPSIPLGCKRNDMTSSPVPQQIQLELIQEFLCFVLFFSLLAMTIVTDGPALTRSRFFSKRIRPTCFDRALLSRVSPLLRTAKNRRVCSLAIPAS